MFEEQDIVVGPQQTGGSKSFSMNPADTWSRHVLIQLQGYFIRAHKQENWLFCLLISLLVTMELCHEFSAARPRHALRNIITSKTLQGLIREMLSPPKMPRTTKISISKCGFNLKRRGSKGQREGK